MAEDVCVGTIDAKQLQGQKMNGLCTPPKFRRGTVSLPSGGKRGNASGVDNPAPSCSGRSVLPAKADYACLGQQATTDHL